MWQYVRKSSDKNLCKDIEVAMRLSVSKKSESDELRELSGVDPGTDVYGRERSDDDSASPQKQC